MWPVVGDPDKKTECGGVMSIGDGEGGAGGRVRRRMTVWGCGCMVCGCE